MQNEGERRRAKRRWMSPKYGGVTGDQSGHKRAQAKKKVVDVTKCHAWHAKRRWVSPSATPATQSTAASPATNPVQARHQSQPSAISATQSCV